MKIRKAHTHLIPALLLASAAGALTLVTGTIDGKTRPSPDEIFVTSDQCQACHNNLAVKDGEDLSIGVAWRGTMMAHSAKDPYWLAGVRRETMDHPTARAAIEEECSTCHMPMAHIMQEMVGGAGMVLPDSTDDPTAEDGPHGPKSQDGVSCAVCHQITKKGLGERESFTGGFHVDLNRHEGERRILGPFQVAKATTRVMRSASGFDPEKGAHVQTSEFCATCHTLYTHSLDEDGNELGTFPEQVPYLEWLHSDNATGKADPKTCQDCHMKEETEKTPASSVVGKPREEFSSHSFRGGNFFMLKLIGANRRDVGSGAQAQDLDVSVRNTQDHLQSEAAKITVPRDLATLADGKLNLKVLVENLAGHKLPTAYPSRRVWIQVTVEDSKGDAVFDSGALTAEGSIAGNDNDADAARFEPHRDLITAPDQVQIYEAIMNNPAGEVTTGLLDATSYVKDNRIIPTGFDKSTAEPDVAVHGTATEDGSFKGGADTVGYSISADDDTYRVTARLWYQPVGFRWARNLEEYDADEPNRFIAMYNAMPKADTAVLLAQDSISIAPEPVDDCPPEQFEPGETPAE